MTGHGRWSLIGDSPLVVAEVGLNHDGDAKQAHRLVDLVADAGAGGIKFQNYRSSDFLSDDSLMFTYRVGDREIEESQLAMFRRCEISASLLAELAAHSRERRLRFLSTPTSTDTLAELVAVQPDGVKNGSDYLGHLPLVAAMARTGLPVVLSTGMADVAEIDEAVRTHRAAGSGELILLVCTSTYPTPPEDVHLRRIGSLAAAFGCPVGFSDHTDGVAAATAAVALGAVMVEKHVTYDRNAVGPDHRFSSDPDELAALCAAVSVAHRALGEPTLGSGGLDDEGRRSFRLSCVAARDLVAGTILLEADVAFRRPGTGMAPRDAPLLVGRELRRPLGAGELIDLGDVR